MTLKQFRRHVRYLLAVYFIAWTCRLIDMDCRRETFDALRHFVNEFGKEP